MLADFFKIQYRHPLRTPIQLSIDGNCLKIDCRFHYNRRALRIDPTSGLCLADYVEGGIRHFWSGLYELGLPGLDEPVEVSVTISREKDRLSVPIRVRRIMLMPPHVISPLHRRFWGIFKTGQIESIGTNWSLEHPGRMELQIYPNLALIERVAAHEAGHLFGLGDAYGAIYRFYHAVPGTEEYMMNSNTAVHPEEILMLLRAHETGRMQFFPRKWDRRQFAEGFWRDLERRAERLQQKVNQWREKRRGSDNGE